MGAWRRFAWLLLTIYVSASSGPKAASPTLHPERCRWSRRIVHVRHGANGGNGLGPATRRRPVTGDQNPAADEATRQGVDVQTKTAHAYSQLRRRLQASSVVVAAIADAGARAGQLASDPRRREATGTVVQASRLSTAWKMSSGQADCPRRGKCRSGRIDLTHGGNPRRCCARGSDDNDMADAPAPHSSFCLFDCC
jgi:hypothetical protein